MWISEEQCSRQSEESGSRNGVDMGPHLVCSRNIKEARVAEVEEARGRAAVQGSRFALSGMGIWKNLRSERSFNFLKESLDSLC